MFKELDGSSEEKLSCLAATSTADRYKPAGTVCPQKPGLGLSH